MTSLCTARSVLSALVLIGLTASALAAGADGAQSQAGDQTLEQPVVRVIPASAPQARQLIEWAGAPRGDSPRARRYWLRALPERLELAMQSEGWYEVPLTVRDSQFGVEIEVGQGVEVILNEIAVSVPRARSEAPGLLSWIRDNAPQLGTRLQHASYEAFKSGLLSRAISLGFLDARYERQQLSVAVGRATASIDLALALGQGYRFGPIAIKESPLRPDIVRNFAPFRAGDRYTAEALAAYTRSLRDSQYFASVRVIPAFDERANATVPLEVEIDPRQPNRVRLGLGYATDVGLRLRVGWDRFLIDEGGHTASVDSELSDPRRNLNAEYRMPDATRPATRAWLISAGAQRESIEGLAATQQNARVARERRHGESLVDTAYVRFQRDRGLPGDTSVAFRALMAGLDVQFGRELQLGQARGLELDGSFQGLVAHEGLGADFSFQRAYARITSRIELQPRHWLVSRLEMGRIWDAKVDVMPVSLRFFAGGDGSIRGFGPREASPLNQDGVATGGSRLLVGSLEYEYRIRGNWGAAVFADRGRAWALSGEPVRTGAGVGLRWYSPVGPVQIDVARPVDEGDWRLHLAIGL